MLSQAERSKAADILMAAQKERKQAVQLTTTFPAITIEDSYAISTEVANRRIAAGARLIGHKVGLTSKAMQRSSMIDEPDFGFILDDQMIADGAKVKHSDYCKPRVEVELAFVIGKRLLGPGVGLADVLRATEYVIPALEIVDARIQDPRKIVDTVTRAGATVVGPVPLPTEKNVIVVIRSPHKYKDSREHFEKRTHKRLIDIIDPTPKAVDSLMRLDLPADVNIEIKL